MSAEVVLFRRTSDLTSAVFVKRERLSVWSGRPAMRRGRKRNIVGEPQCDMNETRAKPTTVVM